MVHGTATADAVAIAQAGAALAAQEEKAVRSAGMAGVAAMAMPEADAAVMEATKKNYSWLATVKILPLRTAQMAATLCFPETAEWEALDKMAALAAPEEMALDPVGMVGKAVPGEAIILVPEDSAAMVETDLETAKEELAVLEGTAPDRILEEMAAGADLAANMAVAATADREAPAIADPEVTAERAATLALTAAMAETADWAGAVTREPAETAARGAILLALAMAVTEGTAVQATAAPGVPEAKVVTLFLAMPVRAATAVAAIRGLEAKAEMAATRQVHSTEETAGREAIATLAQAETAAKAETGSGAVTVAMAAIASKAMRGTVEQAEMASSAAMEATVGTVL